MNEKTRLVLNILGGIAAINFMFFSFILLGWVKVALFIIFIILALQDALSAKVNVVTFLPAGILLLLYYPGVLLDIFAPVFGILMLMWAVVGILQAKISRLDPDKNYFGFGDVLGVPLAVTISQVFIPILGLAAFAFGVMLVSWKFPGRKQLRLLPWLIPGVLLAFLTALVL